MNRASIIIMPCFAPKSHAALCLCAGKTGTKRVYVSKERFLSFRGPVLCQAGFRRRSRKFLPLCRKTTSPIVRGGEDGVVNHYNGRARETRIKISTTRQSRPRRLAENVCTQ